MKKFPDFRPSRRVDENGLPDVSPYAFMAPAPWASSAWRPEVKTVVKKEKHRFYKEVNRRMYR